MDSDCKQTFLGQKQTEDMTLGLYRNIASSDKEGLDYDFSINTASVIFGICVRISVRQENVLLVPLEVSRLISTLFQSREEVKEERDKSALK